MVTINRAIKRAIEIKGKSLLSDSQLLLLVLEDLVPGLEKERNLISECHTSEIGTILVNIYDLPYNQKNKMYDDLKSQLIKQHPEKSKEYSCYISFFADVLGCLVNFQEDNALKSSIKTSAVSNTTYRERPSNVQTNEKSTAQRSPPASKPSMPSPRKNARDTSDIDDAVDRYFNKSANTHRFVGIKKIVFAVVLLLLVISIGLVYAFGNKSSDKDKSTPIQGDLNGDGIMNEDDLIILQNYIIDINSIPEDKRQIADYDGDGKITSHDAMKMKKDLKGE